MNFILEKIKQFASVLLKLLATLFHIFKIFLEKVIGTLLRKKGFTLSSVSVAFIILLILIGIFVGVRQYSTQLGGGNKGPRMRPVSVVIDAVKSGDITVTQTSLGTVIPRNIINIQTQVSGILTQVFFKEGDDVKAGQLLAQIDSRSFEASVKQAQGALDRDTMLLQNTRIDLKRYETLFKQDSISSQVFDTQKALVNQYEGVVLADQGTLEAAKVQLGFTKIISPINGRIGLRLVDPGNYVAANSSNNLFVVTQIRPITAVFTIPQDLLPTYQKIIKASKEKKSFKNYSAFANIPEDAILVEAWDSSNKVFLAKGRLDSIDNVINLSTGTVNLKAIFENEEGNLFPNQFVNMKTILEVKKDVMTMPTKAVQIGTPGNFVYKLNEDNQSVSVVPVKLGARDKDMIMIESGLNLGDKVVIDGTDKLREGAKVVIGKPTPGSLADKRTGGKGGSGASGPSSNPPSGKETNQPQSSAPTDDASRREQWRNKQKDKKEE